MNDKKLEQKIKPQNIEAFTINEQNNYPFFK